MDFRLPEFDFEEAGNILTASQGSNRTSSQLSPLDRDISFGASTSIIGGFDISGSSKQGAFQLQLPFGRDSMTSQKPGGGSLNLGGEEELLPAFDDWGIEVDADGNVIPVVDEPELPALPPLLPGELGGGGLTQPQKSGHNIDVQGDIVMDLGEGEFLPDAEALPKAPFELPSEEGTISRTAPAPLRQRKARQPVLLTPDNETKVSKLEFRAWDKEYVARQEVARNKINISTGPAQAAKNAWNLLFGRGLMDVGILTGIPGCIHPLAEQFSGVGLAKSIGMNIDFEDPSQPRGGRRSAEVAFGPEEDEERRVRIRVDDGEQVGRNIQDQEDMLPMFDQEVEVGREPGSALSDLASSVPWNRPLSAAPGSSVHGSAKAVSFQAGRRVSASPLQGRGTALPDIERLSDQPGFGSDGLEPHYTSSIHGGAGHDSGIQDEQLIRDANDRESHNFLGFLERVAGEKGAIRASGEMDSQRLWVSFDDLFEEEDSKRVVVTQAFCNVLALASRSMIKVEQDGQNKVPFGTIRLGVLASE